jgi:O-antigen/teichoic acid export membrane protein
MSIGRAIVWFGAAYGVAIAGYLGLNAAAGRMLGADSFGAFVAALTLATVAGQIGLLGVHRAGLREASRLQRDDVDQLGELRRGVRAVALVSLPAAAVVTGILTWLVLLAQDETASSADRAVLAVSVAALVVLSGLQKLWANFLRGFGQVRFASMLEGRSGGALVAVSQAVLVALVWLLFPAWGLAGALAAVVVGYAIPVGLASRAVSRFWDHTPSQTQIFRDLREISMRHWKFASVQVAALLNSSVEIWIAGFVLAASQTSMFGAAQRLSLLVVLPMTAMQVVFSPSVSRLAVAGDRAELEKVLRTGATIATAVTAVVALPLLVAPGPIVRIVFGPEFSDAVIPLMVLTTAFLVNAMTGLAGLTLSMAHREGVAARVQWVTVVVRVAVGTLVAAKYGLIGLSISAAVMSVLMFVVMWQRARTVVGVNTAVTTHVDLSLVRRPAGADE